MSCVSKKIGIIGGGQLGAMMILEAKKMGFYITVLDPTPHCPAHSICDEHIVADFDDERAIRDLADKSDVVTYEFEHINAAFLKQLEDEGKTVYPTAKSLLLIQNKLTQKQLLQKNGIPVADFIEVKDINDIYNAGKLYGYPFILKTCTGGYDGKGNYVIKNKEDAENGHKALGGGSLPLMAEKLFNFKMEVSVLACRTPQGDVESYPVAENIHKDSILDETRVPAEISSAESKKASDLAAKVMHIFDGVGMFCVEMFIGKNGEVLVNEVAPRPHNSGHYTIEACLTSQFEQHIRAVSGLPLGSPELRSPAVMRNILGEEGWEGKTVVEGDSDCLAVKGAYLHIYGKEISKPKRKMGHITVVADTLDKAAERANTAKAALIIRGENHI